MKYLKYTATILVVNLVLWGAMLPMHLKPGAEPTRFVHALFFGVGALSALYFGLGLKRKYLRPWLEKQDMRWITAALVAVLTLCLLWPSKPWGNLPNTLYAIDMAWFYLVGGITALLASYGLHRLGYDIAYTAEKAADLRDQRLQLKKHRKYVKTLALEADALRTIRDFGDD
ncbi:MAG: hypothetical protein WAX89_01420 [Alphaproteobacteria bacterium]